MSPTTLIFGGHGKVAQHLTRILTQQTTPAHTVHSIIRNADQSDTITSLGGKPIVQSIEESSVADFTATIKKTNPDFVVWSAGAGGGNPERTQAVDREGAIKSMDACAEAGVKRYIIVSALDVRDRENKPVPEWYDDESKRMSDRVWGAIEPYLKAKLAADRSLRMDNRRRGLEYTIVRPGGLSTEPGKGTVQAGKVRLGSMVSREDVARTVVAIMEDSGTVGLAFDVVGGGVPIKEAVATVANDKVDTFEGYY
ncbi:Rossmann-fold NAD(P)(+)-binding protein [Pseudomassariella vexata]|uniref:Rossmann-fold NAD(P)(+)-binding protein n=1 Tax=Pseudomassariella vexata TaxID=1141098 RepID=A0A1Y2DEL1_9PEZI|nr:Rossmann-fold NAD(P)(+)-binding protein [Pseudomassariella vexata]ORY57566.1 Rossmann-fold NAD(P)(+)-binding protein [Pseudomassariella vexata]